MFTFYHSPSLTERILANPEKHPIPSVTFLPGDRVCFGLYNSYVRRTFEALFYLNDWSIEEMKRGTKYGVDFVPMRLSLDQKAAFQAWANDNVADLGDYLTNLVGNGYKLSMNLDPNNDCYIVAVTGTDENKWNRGLCITSRSDDLIEAVMMTVYKVVVIYDNGEWDRPENMGQDWG